MVSDEDCTEAGAFVECFRYERELSLWISYLVASLFTRTFYRVFILRCEYPTRLFSFCVYKGNEEMGIRKMVT
jgi:hypothetical protein